MNLKKTTSPVDRSAYVDAQIYPKDLKSPWQSHLSRRGSGWNRVGAGQVC
jgi:hypothetical protein